MPPEAVPPESSLGVVVPTLGSAAGLGHCLAALDHGGSLVGEIVVADGGSTDATRAVAARYGARVINTARGRGAQLAAGAALVTAPWLLFLHADTWLAPGWAEAARGFIADPGNAARAAAFRFTLDDATPAARRLEAVVAWRSRALALPYGDQGLLIARTFYDALGGFRPLPLMEDVELVRCIGRARLALLDAAAVTSAERYRRAGYLRRSARNLACLGLYFAGLPTRTIARLYG